MPEQIDCLSYWMMIPFTIMMFLGVMLFLLEHGPRIERVPNFILYGFFIGFCGSFLIFLVSAGLIVHHRIGPGTYPVIANEDGQLCIVQGEKLRVVPARQVKHSTVIIQEINGYMILIQGHHADSCNLLTITRPSGETLPKAIVTTYNYQS